MTQSGPASLAPVRVALDRLTDITVCLRPFRPAGPRLDTEVVGDKLVVHNYGHGGSGWSLSWGSGMIAVRKAMASSPHEIAIIGCGALGITAARLAQRAGVRVTIYAKELLSQTYSAKATGSWTPASRIAHTGAAGPAFGALWEGMARESFAMFGTLLGAPGDPVEWSDRYTLSDVPIDAPAPADGMLDWGRYDELVRDLTPPNELLPTGASPFDAPYVSRSQSLTFNIASYARMLLGDFFAAGGQFRQCEFHRPADLAALSEPVVINCTGYGARALWEDRSVVPVRGQIAWLTAQPELRYGVYYKDVSMLSRRDVLVVQAMDGGDMKGYDNSDERPDRRESEAAIATIADLFSRFGAKGSGAR